MSTSQLNDRLINQRSIHAARLVGARALNSGPGRLARFGAVGGATALVQLSMLQLLKSAGIDAVTAYAAGLLISCQFNFTLNCLLVWGDRPVASARLRTIARRWVTYHACIAFAVALNFGVFVVARAFVADIPAGVIAILASTFVKFLSLDRLAFKAETI